MASARTARRRDGPWRVPRDRGTRPDAVAIDGDAGSITFSDAPHTLIAHEPYVREVARILDDAFAAVEPSPHRPATMKP